MQMIEIPQIDCSSPVDMERVRDTFSPYQPFCIVNKSEKKISYYAFLFPINDVLSACYVIKLVGRSGLFDLEISALLLGDLLIDSPSLGDEMKALAPKLAKAHNLCQAIKGFNADMT